MVSRVDDERESGLCRDLGYGLPAGIFYLTRTRVLHNSKRLVFSYRRKSIEKGSGRVAIPDIRFSSVVSTDRAGRGSSLSFYD